MFRSFGPRHVQTGPGQVLAWKGNNLVCSAEDTLVAWDSTPPGDTTMEEADARRLPSGFSMPRGVEVAFRCTTISAGTLSVVLAARCFGVYTIIDQADFTAAGQTVYARWAVHTPHWKLYVAKTGGGVGVLSGRVVAVFD